MKNLDHLITGHWGEDHPDNDGDPPHKFTGVAPAFDWGEYPGACVVCGNRNVLSHPAEALCRRCFDWSTKTKGWWSK